MDDKKRAAHIAAARRYNARNYKQLNIAIRPDDYDAIDRAAVYAGQSRTAYILQAVRERIARDDAPAAAAPYNPPFDGDGDDGGRRRAAK